jgi:hypothetical protein
MTANYREIKSESAADFVNDLQQVLLEDRLPEINSRFVFRGQGNAAWGLVPSAFRCGTVLGYENREYSRVAGESPRHTWDQGNAEFVALVEFLRLADEVGLDVPADHHWVRQWNPFNNVVGHSIGSDDWPPSELYEAIAIAQHHGVPTRLLDFSYNPIIAAYFAAEDPPVTAEEIAVWCVDLQLISLAAKDLHCPFEIVSVSRVRNRNLAAQRALFLLDRSVFDGRYAFESTIAEHIRSGAGIGRVPEGSSGVRKFSLPKSECGSLLDLLGKLGVDRAHLMPSFDGVVEELKSRRRRRMTGNIPIIGSSD